MKNRKLVNVLEKQAIIFDMDGTLYSQRKMRIYMMVKMLFYYGIHFWKIKEGVIVYQFRKLREVKEHRKDTIEEIMELVAKKVGVESVVAQICICYWMFEVPLQVIEKCSYRHILTWIEELKHAGKKIYIYSDYPAEKKAEKLGIITERIFTSEYLEIGEQKPSRKAMDYILKEIHVPVEQILYVGDRYEKDGLSAAMAGIDYCDIQELRKWLLDKAK